VLSCKGDSRLNWGPEGDLPSHTGAEERLSGVVKGGSGAETIFLVAGR